MEGGGEANDGGGAITSGNEVTEADGSDDVTINVRFSNCTKIAVHVSLESSVVSFKSVLAKHCDIPADEQHFIYRGRFLKDDQTLRSYGLKAEHTVDLIPAKSNNTENTVEEGTIGGSAGSLPFTLNSGFLEMMDHEFLEIMDRVNNTIDAVLNSFMNDPLLREIINRDPELALLVNALAASSDGGGGTNPDPLSRLSLQNQAISKLLNQRSGEMMQNPAFNLPLTLPETMQPSLLSQLGQQQSTRGASQTDGQTVTTARDSENITNMVSGPETKNASNVGPEEVGFSNTRLDREALRAAAGDVLEAMDRLLGNHRGQ